MAYRRTPAVQARLDKQRVDLVHAAASLLADEGYAACSVAAVAARAGIAAGTVYKHFDSKADLVAEVFRTVVSREVAAVREAVEAESDVTGRVAAVVETFAGRALKSPRLAYALLTEPVDPAVDELRLEFRIAFRDIAAAAISDGVRRGVLPPQNADVVAAALVGAIGEALGGPLAAGTDDADTVPTLIQFAHRAIGAPVPKERAS
ncbi:MAG TPA: TetR/AcrR family transcriptional regulator [Jatrophihabitantaceae bacterium]|nr:TetR/AcrR family transcriptional regulator [Jatrophihabitantaceae bacterium]